MGLIKVLIILLSLSLSSMAFSADITTNTSTTTSEHTVSDGFGDATTTTNTTTKVNTTDQDQQIVTAISDRFANDTVLTGTSLTAVSQNGIVTLTGTVTMQSQADQAVSIAQSIPGVSNVISQITVETNPQSP